MGLLCLVQVVTKLFSWKPEGPEPHSVFELIQAHSSKNLSLAWEPFKFVLYCHCEESHHILLKTLNIREKPHCHPSRKKL